MAERTAAGATGTPKTLFRLAGPMQPPATPFFRDVTLPSHAQDRAAHRRHQHLSAARAAKPPREPAWPRVLRALRLRPAKAS